MPINKTLGFTGIKDNIKVTDILITHIEHQPHTMHIVGEINTISSA